MSCVMLSILVMSFSGPDHLIERIESRDGTRTVESAAALGVGSPNYALIEL